MKILITSIVDLRKTSHNRLHQFIKFLSQNHEIVVLSINDWWKVNQTNVELYSQGFENAINDITIEYFTQRKISPTLQEMTAVFTSRRLLNKINYRNFDVHLNYSSLISGNIISRRMKSRGIKTVYDIADDLPAMVRASPQIPAILRPLGGFIANIALKDNIKTASHVTIIAESLRRSINMKGSKSSIIHNGVDVELFSKSNCDNLKKQLNIDNSFIIGYVGVLREWVDLEPIFAAVRRLENEAPNINIKVLIVGEEGGLIKNKEIANRYQISDKVIFTGTVPYMKVPEYVSCMDICMIPFKKNAIAENSFPLKLLEYMSCEKPVIATPLDGIRESVSDKVMYALGAEEIKQRIKELYQHEELRKKMGMNGRAFVIDKFSWPRVCSQLEQILMETSKGK